MKKGWEIKALGEVCELYQPSTISKKEMLEDGEFYVYGANGIIGKYDKYNHENAELLITCRGATCGSVNVSLPKSWINGNAMVVRPINNSINIKFLEYLFLGGINLTGIISGAAQPQITRRSLIPLKIAYPKSLNEQQRIVSILDKVFAAIDKTKTNTGQNLKNAKEFFERYLQGVFNKQDKNWELKLLKDIAIDFSRGKSKHRPRNWKGLYGGIYPFIQTGDVRKTTKYISDFTQTYNDIGLKQSKLWRKNTLCITIAANIAESAILDFDACFPDSIIGLEVDVQKVDLDYTYYLLQYYKTDLQNLGKGSAQDNINLGTFENKYFPFPKTIGAQKDISGKLDELNKEVQKMEKLYLKKLDYLEELKKSILHKAFAGELTS